ncbi:MAG TPA: EamA family transporter [Aestuariivirga sp.]|nr:EamA family transporter [Aestuariivirga sp.]
MSPAVFFAVLAAAFFHAGWNLLVKLKLDRLLALFLLQVMIGGMALVMLAVFPWPAAAALPFAVTTGMLHAGYNVFLARAYETADLSQIYPIARGTAPLVTLLGATVFAGDRLSAAALFGLFVVVAGIWLIATGGRRALALDGRSLGFALVTSLFIGVYTVVDGMGARASGAPSGYTATVFLFDALFMTLATLALRGRGIFAAVVPHWRSGLMAAALSLAAYWIVLWAMTEAPIAAVAALRETSILFVMVLSALFLKERITPARGLGGALVVAGAMLLRFA